MGASKQLKEWFSRILIKLLATHSSDISESDFEDIFLSEEDIISHLRSGNYVIQTTKGFFRFIPKNAKKDQFFKNRVGLHLLTVNFSLEEQQSISFFLSRKKHRQSFLRMVQNSSFKSSDYRSVFKEFYSRIRMFDKEYDAISDDYCEKFFDFCYRLHSDLRLYMWGRPRDKWLTFSYNRIFATKVLYNVLGFDYLTPKVSLVKLHMSNRWEDYGMMQSSSGGIYPLKLGKSMQNSVSPVLQNELIALNILDALCYEKDHRPGNYYIHLDDDKKVSTISVFDNDCKWTFFPLPKVNYKTYFGSSPLIVNNYFCRPYISVDFVNLMQKLNFACISKSLGSYLNTFQILGIKIRFRRLNSAIAKSLQIGKCNTLSLSQWSTSTINHELSGGYGNTYLSVYYGWYEIMLKKHPEVFSSHNINFRE